MLSNKELKERTEKQLDELFAILRNKASEKLRQALVSDAIPDYFYDDDNYMLAKVVLESVQDMQIFKVQYPARVQADFDDLLEII